MSVWTAARTLGEATVSLPPHGLATVDVPVRPFGGDGPRLVSAAVRPAGRWLGPTFDDRRDGVVDVVAPARVLVVTDDPAAAFPLRAALAPAAGGRPCGAATRPWSRSPAGASWTPPDPAGYDVVVLADAADVWADRADDLRRFVDDGGGLLIAPGRHVVAAEYDDALGPVDGVGLLPAELAAPRPTRGGGVLRLADVDHPVLGFADGARPTRRPACGWTGRSGWSAGRAGGCWRRSTAGRPWWRPTGRGPGGWCCSTVPLDDTWATLTGRACSCRWCSRPCGGWRRGADAGTPRGWPGRPIVVRVDGAVDGGVGARCRTDGGSVPGWSAGGPVGAAVRADGQPGTYRMRYRVGRRERSAFVVVTAGRRRLRT